MRASERPWLPPLLAVLPFLPLLGAPRMVDERILAFGAIKWLALDPLAPWTVPAGGSGTWRPLLVYLDRLDAEAPAVVAHAINLGLHALAAVLVHRLLLRRLSPRGALLGACFFAVHPAHVATAGWIGGRADGAMVVFALAALLAVGRPWLAALAAVVAIGFKETGVAVLPMLLLLAWADGRARRALPALILGGAAFAASLAISQVDPGYSPGLGDLGSILRWAPLSALEVVAPGFVPVGLPSVPRDVLGFLLSLVVGGALVAWGWRRREARLGLALVGLGLLPVLHVLGNDGGQWYLLLPSVGAALLWGDLGARRPRGVVLVVAICALLSVGEALRWRQAAITVDATIEAQRDARPRRPPPPQDPRRWPHRGPSFCCGLPYELYADPRGE